MYSCSSGRDQDGSLQCWADGFDLPASTADFAGSARPVGLYEYVCLSVYKVCVIVGGVVVVVYLFV